MSDVRSREIIEGEQIDKHVALMEERKGSEQDASAPLDFGTAGDVEMKKESVWGTAGQVDVEMDDFSQD